jgi:hypothetical protein
MLPDDRQLPDHHRLCLLHAGASGDPQRRLPAALPSDKQRLENECHIRPFAREGLHAAGENTDETPIIGSVLLGFSSGMSLFHRGSWDARNQ